MCRSAVIAKMVNLAQEKSPANKVCRDLRDGGGKLGSVRRVSREARKELPVTVQQFVHN